jgi:hypothetical protein
LIVTQYQEFGVNSLPARRGIAGAEQEFARRTWGPFSIRLNRKTLMRFFDFQKSSATPGANVSSSTGRPPHPAQRGAPERHGKFRHASSARSGASPGGRCELHKYRLIPLNVKDDFTRASRPETCARLEARGSRPFHRDHPWTRCPRLAMNTKLGAVAQER